MNSFKKNNRLVRAVFILVFIACTHASYAQSSQMKEAFHYIEIEQPSRALKIIDVLSVADKPTLEEQYYVGLGYIRLGRLDNAIKAFEKGIALKEKHGLNYAGKAHALIFRNESTEADALLKRALDLGKNKNPEILTAVAAAYIADSTNVPKAVELLTKAKALSPGNREINMLLGDAYLLLNEGGKSVSSYEWAAKADPTWAEPYLKIALVYNRAKNKSMVFESLNKAIKVDSQFAPAYKRLGEIYYLRKEADKAVDAYEKYLAITENPGDARFQYAFFLIMAKQFDKANEIFKSVINSNNAPPIAYKYYAYSLLEQDTTRKNAELARPLLEKYISQLKPGEVQASDHAYYGKVLLKLGQDSLAGEYFTKSIALDSAQEDILRLYGQNLMQHRNFQRAAEVYQKLVDLDPTPPLQDLWSLGRAYYFDEQYVDADSTFEEMMDKQAVDKLPFQVLLFSARSKANIDSTMATGLAKPMYEAFLDRISTNLSKYDDEAIEGYSYLGAYYVHKEENIVKAKACYQKILELDASNPTAKEFMKVINESAQKKGG
ncbi:MAG TPA: tetratricopeptide repeat protein [Ohtaekwangia sp.]